MAKNPVTASERRGILVVAALALLIIATIFFVNRCVRSSESLPPPEVKIISLPDTVSSDSLPSKDKREKRKKRKKHESDTLRHKKKGSSKGKTKKFYRTRSPLDETV